MTLRKESVLCVLPILLPFIKKKKSGSFLMRQPRAEETYVQIANMCEQGAVTTCILGYELMSTVACDYVMLLPVLLIKKKYLFIYLWLRWVFAAACGLSLVAASGGYSSLLCMGFSSRWLLLLQRTGSKCSGFSHGVWAQVVHGMWNLGLNPCPLHGHADS